jgi:DnaJ-class molecular chaperone
MSDELWECDACDGCGTYEGGPFLLTRCEKCKGTGAVPAECNVRESVDDAPSPEPA